MTDSPNPDTAAPRVRWRHSLYVRITVLCAVLLCCLLASVFLITRHFFTEARAEMERQAEEIAGNVDLLFESDPEVDFDTLEKRVSDLHEGFTIDIEESSDDAIGDPVVTDNLHADGSVTRSIRLWLRLVGDRPVRMTIEVPVAPQTEILRAFRNRYILALALVFLLVLALMVVVIAGALRPLRQLSEGCAAIAEGRLEPVESHGASGEILSLERTFNQMVGSLRDKEEMEARLHQAQRLSALGNLTAGIAHDVRNPLNAIKLLSSHALDNLDPKDAAAAKSVETIRQEVGRLEDIVSGFLSLAKERQLAPEPTRIDDVLDECARLVSKDAEARGVRFHHDLRAGDTTLELDGKQMTRAILNVLLNGLEAAAPAGSLGLTSRLTDRCCEVEILDSGPGLPAEVADRVFEPYYTTKPGGTGLGLSITRGIIEEHGGSIELYSMEGQGCQVLIRLPLKRA